MSDEESLVNDLDLNLFFSGDPDIGKYIYNANQYLTVIFSEKNEVKELGARWDKDKKMWYIPPGNDIHPFLRWFPYTIRPMTRSDNFYLLHSVKSCWKCSKLSPIYAFALTGSKVLGGYNYNLKIRKKNTPVICSYVKSISRRIHETIIDKIPSYNFDYSKKINSYYWVNHCSNCYAVLGDFYIHHDYGYPFYPNDEQKGLVYSTRFDIPFISDTETNEFNYFDSIPKS